MDYDGKKILSAITASTTSYIDSCILTSVVLHRDVWIHLFNLSESQADNVLLLSFNLVSIALGALFGGYYGDTLGRLGVFKQNLVIYMTALILILFSTDQLTFLIACCACAFAVGCNFVVGRTLVAEYSKVNIYKTAYLTMLMVCLAPLMIIIFNSIMPSQKSAMYLTVIHMLFILVAIMVASRFMHETKPAKTEPLIIGEVLELCVFNILTYGTYAATLFFVTFSVPKMASSELALSIVSMNLIACACAIFVFGRKIAAKYPQTVYVLTCAVHVCVWFIECLKVILPEHCLHIIQLQLSGIVLGCGFQAFYQVFVLRYPDGYRCRIRALMSIVNRLLVIGTGVLVGYFCADGDAYFLTGFFTLFAVIGLLMAVFRYPKKYANIFNYVESAKT